MTINDYLGLIGFSGLSLGLGFTFIGLFAGVYFLIKKESTFGWISRVIFLFQSVCLALAAASLGGLLLNNSFEYPLVFDGVEKSMPWVQKLSGLWSGQSSSLLFWSFILSLVIVIISRISKKIIDERFSVLTSVILGVALVFFLVPVLVISNPFEKLWQLSDGSTMTAIFAPVGAGLIVPVDGVGMNPSLRHIAMLLHPPFLYLGLVGFFAPYAVSLAALILGESGHKWVKLLMPVTLAAWVCLTIGMVLGSWWAYTILGWGGYWGWDAVEIAGLLPWLLSFGLIHSLRMQLSGKDYLRWIMVFSGLIFVSILSGILITRSGILESVHAYSAGVMGPVLLVFIGINIFVYVYFLMKRWKKLKNKAQIQLEASDLIIRIFNFLILALVLLFFIGQTFPLSSRFFTGTQISWKAEQYELYSSPLLFLVLLITALCPLLNLIEIDKNKFWRRITTLATISLAITAILLINKNVRLSVILGFWVVFFLIAAWIDQIISQIIVIQFKNINDIKIGFSIFASIFIHIGLGLLAIGIMGQETLSNSYDLKISEGESVGVGDFQLRIEDSSQNASPEGQTISSVEISVIENNINNFSLIPALEYYPKIETLYARPAIATNLQRDIQVILKSWPDDINSKFEIHVAINPLMVWLWIGGLIMSLGGLISLVYAGDKFPRK